MKNVREIYRELGEHAFYELTARFYEGVAGDPVLRPLYPEEDLRPARRRLALFLIQFFGGPATYSEERGHPRLRARHMAFPIGLKERDAWLTHMDKALGSLPADEETKEAMRRYFRDAATFLMNQNMLGAAGGAQKAPPRSRDATP